MVQSGLSAHLEEERIMQWSPVVAEAISVIVSPRYMIRDDEVNRAEEDQMAEDDQDWESMKYGNLDSIFKILGISFIIGVVILLMEIATRY